MQLVKTKDTPTELIGNAHSHTGPFHQATQMYDVLLF